MNQPRPREVLSAIPAYRPGRPADDERFKLSSNENHFAPLPGVIEQCAAALTRMNRYPDPGVTALGEALAERTGLTTDHFAFGTGSVSVLFALLDAWCGPGDEVVYAWRSFEAYPIAVDLPGAVSVRVPLTDDHRHDLAAMAAAITDRTKVVLLCTPNNPTGPVITTDEFEEFMTSVPSHVLVVVDEAYVEFVREPDAVKGLEGLRHPNVVVLRTFSKAYGLAGLRVGYSIADPEITESIRKALPPFGVSDLAQAAAVASLHASDELDERVAAVVVERERVTAALREQGWDVPDSHANFVWLPLGDRSAEFAEHVRPVAVRPFPEGVRISLGDPEANDLMLARAAAFR